MVSGPMTAGSMSSTGTKRGFLPRSSAPGRRPNSRAPGWQSMQEYWPLQQCQFRGFNGDGLPIYTGGTSCGSVKISELPPDHFSARETPYVLPTVTLLRYMNNGCRMKASNPIKRFRDGSSCCRFESDLPLLCDWAVTECLIFLPLTKYREGLILSIS